MAKRTMPVPAVRYERDANGGELLYRLRFRYCEKGRLAMLSHLEVAHYLERVVRRAELPFAITNGFSPHAHLVRRPRRWAWAAPARSLKDLLLLPRRCARRCAGAVRAASVPDLLPYACGAHRPPGQGGERDYPKSTYEVVFDCPVTSLAVPRSGRGGPQEEDARARAGRLPHRAACLRGRHDDPQARIEGHGQPAPRRARARDDGRHRREGRLDHTHGFGRITPLRRLPVPTLVSLEDTCLHRTSQAR